MNHRRVESRGQASQAETAGPRSCAAPRSRHRHSISRKGQPVYVDDGRRRLVAGTLGPDGVFVKHVRPEHLLRKPEGIALQLSVLNELSRMGCERVRALLWDGRILTAPLTRFTTRGFPVNRGFGRQVGLCLAHWDDARSPQLALGGLL